MKQLLTCLLFVALLTCWASGQQSTQQPPPCGHEKMNDVGVSTTCAPYIPLPYDSFHATPLMDGTGQSYGDPDGNTVSLYGPYGNNENNQQFQPALAHYTQGTNLAPNVQPRCKDGSAPPDGVCHLGPVDYPAAIVFLFIGFSNWDIEIGGGTSDIWQGQDHPLISGQPCATPCQNLNNPVGAPAWGQVDGDPITQNSLLYQIYSPQQSLVGPHLAVFNGALGKQTLNKWDPTSNGYYWNIPCDLTHQGGTDPECNYHRVLEDLTRNGYTEAQVQAVFLKSADPYPQCDLKGQHCTAGVTEPDAYTAERFMGNILRYLKCCKLNSQHQPTTVPRYPNLQQVFITSRTYGGYAKNPPDGASDTTAGCLNPEPFAFEEGFAVQRLIVAQIRQAAGITSPSDIYSGQLTYDVAPWFDWGPYLWMDGSNSRSDGQYWCGGQPGVRCNGNIFDVRYGDLNDQLHYWGDYTHPSAFGQQKVATLVKNFMVGPTASAWVTPWMQK